MIKIYKKRIKMNLAFELKLVLKFLTFMKAPAS